MTECPMSFTHHLTETDRMLEDGRIARLNIRCNDPKVAAVGMIRDPLIEVLTDWAADFGVHGQPFDRLYYCLCSHSVFFLSLFFI
jgi:hypothetical protein